MAVTGVFGYALPLVLKETATVFSLDNEFPVRVPYIVATCLTYLNQEGACRGDRMPDGRR